MQLVGDASVRFCGVRIDNCVHDVWTCAFRYVYRDTFPFLYPGLDVVHYPDIDLAFYASSNVDDMNDVNDVDDAHVARVYSGAFLLLPTWGLLGTGLGSRHLIASISPTMLDPAGREWIRSLSLS